VKIDIEIVNKVSKRETTKILELDRNSLDELGKIRTKREKIIARLKLTKKTGKFISSPISFLLALDLISPIGAFSKSVVIKFPNL
tara:strand:+ start:4238 stop:4492 length:255 start_codon:yes stop_codon:yes gene_type:complete